MLFRLQKGERKRRVADIVHLHLLEGGLDDMLLKDIAHLTLALRWCQILSDMKKTFFMYVNIYINKYVSMCWLRTKFLKIYDISNSKTFI